MEIPAAQRPRGRRFRMGRAVMALILREMSSTYGRSVGGYLWAFVEPIAGIALLTIVFAFVLRAPPLGSNFAYFYATGIMPFFFFSNINMMVAGSLQYSRALLGYPVMSYLDALTARFLLNGLTQLLVMTGIVTGVVWIYNLNPLLNWPQIFLALAMLTTLTLSIGTFNCFMFNFFPVSQQLWSVITRPLFIVSGIFFIPENLPTQAREYFMYNPLAHVISQFRKGFFETYDAVYVSPVYVFTLSMLFGGFGILFLLKNYKDILLK